MSYATRGNSCNCSSIALTSNAKYIPPLSNVYYDKWTDMWLYPGSTGFRYPFQHPFGPNVLKAWNLDTQSKAYPGRYIVYKNNTHGRRTTHHHHYHKKKKHIQQNRKHCPQCVTS